MSHLNGGFQKGGNNITEREYTVETIRYNVGILPFGKILTVNSVTYKGICFLYIFLFRNDT